MTQRSNVSPFALERGFRRRGGSPPVKNSPSIVNDALLDADYEAIRFLQEVALEVPYGPFAERGIKLQTFLRLRRLAFMDHFEDVTEDVKINNLRGAAGCEVSVEELRKLPEYDEILEKLCKGVVEVTLLQSGEIRDLIARSGRKAVATLARVARSANPLDVGEAARAAAELLEHETPKPSRQGTGTGELRFPADIARMVAKALIDVGRRMPDLPSAEIEEEETIEAEAVDEAKSEA